MNKFVSLTDEEKISETEEQQIITISETLPEKLFTDNSSTEIRSEQAEEVNMEQGDIKTESDELKNEAKHLISKLNEKNLTEEKKSKVLNKLENFRKKIKPGTVRMA